MSKIFTQIDALTMTLSEKTLKIIGMGFQVQIMQRPRKGRQRAAAMAAKKRTFGILRILRGLGIVKPFHRFFTAVAMMLFAVVSSPTHAAPILWVGDSSGNLGTVDVATGNVNVVGSMGNVMTDIAFDPSGNLYGITFGSLYSIDKNTAAATLIGSTGISSNSLVFDSAGTLFTASNSLYTIDVTTGVASLVGNGGFSYDSSGDLAFIGGQLYLSSAPGDNLVLLDTATGIGTLIGDIGQTAVFGLATDNNVDLYGTAGTNVLSINTTTGAGTVIGNYGGQGLVGAFGSAFLAESGGGNGGNVPVPAPLALLGLGLAGIAYQRRKQIKAA